MSKPVSPNYLAGYPAHLTESVWRLIEQDQLGRVLRQKYPEVHQIRTDKALYDYVLEIKASHLRNAPQPSKVAYDGKLQTLQKALGIHSRIARVQGGKLKTKREIHVASIFRDMPTAFLRMIVVHEISHLKEPEHDKSFYQLCQHMEANYFQLEFDLRAYLCYLAAGGPPLWVAETSGAIENSSDS